MNNKHEFVLIYEPKFQKTQKKNPQDIFLLPSFLPLRKFDIVFYCCGNSLFSWLLPIAVADGFFFMQFLLISQEFPPPPPGLLLA